MSSEAASVSTTMRTVSSLPDNIGESEVNAIPKCYEHDTDESSGSTDTPTRMLTTANLSTQMQAATRVPPRTPTPTFVPLRTTTPNSVPSRSPPALNVTSPATTSMRTPLQNYNVEHDGPRRPFAAKKQKTDMFQAALIEALKEPTVQANDPLDGFLARIGEGMRRLPYRNRAQLEITFLTLLAEMENDRADR